MVTLRVWHWYSIDQALAAADFARKAGLMEADPAPPTPDERDRGLTWHEESAREHRSLVIAAVLSSVGFLEALVNETFAAAAHTNLEMTGRLGPSERAQLAAGAEMLANNRLLDRFQLALLLLKRDAFDTGAQPFQAAALVVSVRNKLVHFKPQWRAGGGEDDDTKFERRLRSLGLSSNPFTGEGNPFFPDRVLGASLASWAWDSSLGFADGFCKRLRVDAPYMNHRQHLTS